MQKVKSAQNIYSCFHIENLYTRFVGENVFLFILASPGLPTQNLAETPPTPSEAGVRPGPVHCPRPQICRHAIEAPIRLDRKPGHAGNHPEKCAGTPQHPNWHQRCQTYLDNKLRKVSHREHTCMRHRKKKSLLVLKLSLSLVLRHFQLQIAKPQIQQGSASCDQLARKSPAMM